VRGALHDCGRGVYESGEVITGYIRVHAVAYRLVLELKGELYALSVQGSGVGLIAEPEEVLRDSVVDLGAGDEGLHARDPRRRR
jgi:hypothetical protein